MITLFSNIIWQFCLDLNPFLSSHSIIWETKTGASFYKPIQITNILIINKMVADIAMGDICIVTSNSLLASFPIDVWTWEAKRSKTWPWLLSVLLQEKYLYIIIINIYLIFICSNWFVNIFRLQPYCGIIKGKWKPHPQVSLSRLKHLRKLDVELAILGTICKI